MSSSIVLPLLQAKLDSADIPRLRAAGLVGFAGVALFYFIYQIFFHPLAGYPGPFLAKISRLWLFYEEVIIARPTERIMELHKIYGPVVRISPNEISINDMNVYDKIYNQSSQFTKAPFFYDVFANKSGNLFTYTSRAEHTHYKRLMTHVFSRAQISKLEPSVYEKTSRVLDRIARAAAKSEPISLYMASRCLTLEVISEFAFGEAEPAIDGEGGGFKGVGLFDAFDSAAAMTPALSHMALVRSIMRAVTDYLPGDPFRSMGDRAQSGLSALATKEAYDIDHPMIFESMLAQAKKNGVELDRELLISQGIMVLIAGTDTTAMSLSYGLHCMLSRPEIYKRLQKELASIMPTPDSQPTLLQLESCAYLGGCVRETLRLATAVRGRLPRVVPPSGFELYGKMLPEGVVVGGSSLYSHFNESIFESPHEFKPERWMGSDSEVKALERFLIPFSKGKRMCIGSNLAQMEIYIAMSQFVSRFDLVELLDKDIVIKDHFTAFITQGIEVMLKERNATE